MPTQATRFIGSIPENYDSGLGPHLFADYATELAARTAALEPGAVLELAAGTGIMTRRLRDLLASDCELIASDLNPPMLEVAKAKFQAGERVSFEQVDANQLQYDESSFDVVVCQFGVMFFPDKGRSHSEVRRVLRPGGRYLFNVWASWDWNPFARLTHEAVAAFFPENPPGFYQVPFSYHDAEEIKNTVLGAGFHDVRVDTSTRTSKISSPEVFSKGLVFGNPLYEEIITRGGDPLQICDAVKEAIEDNLGSEMQLRALIVEAVKN